MRVFFLYTYKMSNKRFRHWLKESSNIEEMATFNFGKNKGVDHTQVDPGYLQWMQKQLAAGKSGGFNVTDQGRRLNPDELNTLITQHLGSGAAATVPRTPRSSAGVRNTPGGNLEPPEGMKLVPKPAGWRGPFAAKFNDNNGRFKKGDMIYWDGQRGGQSVPAFVPEDMDIGDESGNVEDMVDKIHGVSRPSLEQVKIPPENMTEFNQEIENRFTQGSDNIMVNALAGTGKTTMLKHLASFIQPGEKWLYLVFNKKNQLESQNEFPKGVTVMTTHSFLGKLLNGTDKALGGGTRLPPPTWKRETKLSKLADNRQVTPLEWPESSQSTPTDMPVYKTNADGKKEKTGQTERIMVSPWHGAARRRAIKIASRAKAVALNPNDPNIEQQIAELVEKYALDTEVAKPNSKKQPEKDYTEDIIKKAAEFLRLSQPEAADQYMPYASGVRDQDDTLWYAAVHADQINWNMGYDVVLMDEVQDFNNCQIIMAQKLKEAGARVIAVGDPNQCHPAGTMVHMTGGSIKAIEELKEGEEVVTFNTKKTYFPGLNKQGRKIEGIAKRFYKGNLIKITAGDYSHECTPNHKCLVRFCNTKDMYCLYLMVKGEHARIGICKLNYRHGFGISLRAKAEKADRVWLLDVFGSCEDARIAESVSSCIFSLPQVVFEHTGDCSPSERFITEVYNKVGNNLDKAINCLDHYGKLWNYPIWSKDQKERFGSLKQNYISSKKSFITQACNLISGCMSVKLFNGYPRDNRWEPIEVSNRYVETDVYSLNVQATEDSRKLYIANNIVTHNSMYLFRGADGDAFDKLQDTIGAGDSAPLPINFRSGGNILDWVNQNTHVNNMQYPQQNAGQGEVWANGGTHEPVGYEDFMYKMMDEWDNNKKFEHDTAMIARTNAPLAHAALTFLKNNIDFQIVGTDLPKEIIDLIKKVTNGKANNVPVDQFMEDLAAYSEKCQRMWANKISKLDELKEVRAYTGVLQAVYEHLAEQGFRDGENSPPIQTAGALGNWVYARLGGVNENSFDDMKAMEERKKAEPGSFITLTTAHKSKGLEYDRAFLMKPSQFDPESDMIKTEEEAQQERNAWYVAATRAKKVLMVSGDDEPDAQSGDSDDALDSDEPQNPYMTKKMRMF